MNTIAPDVLLVSVGVFLFAGAIKGLLGIGLPTVAIALLTLLVDPRIAIALLLLPALSSNAWQIYRGGQILQTIKRLWLFVACMIAVMVWVVQFAAEAPKETLLLAIGIMILLWALSSLIKSPPPIPARLDRLAQCIAGCIAGFTGGLTGLWTPSTGVYLLASRVDKDDFVRGVGLLVFSGMLPLTVGYWFTGLLDTSLVMSSAVMIVPTLLGFAIGEHLRRFIRAEQFTRWVLAGFCILGASLIWRGVG